MERNTVNNSVCQQTDHIYSYYEVIRRSLGMGSKPKSQDGGTKMERK